VRKDKQQATVLRKSGMSYSDIIARMAVPRSTLSKWFRDQKWSNDIATECASKARNGGAIRFAVLNTVRRGRLDSLHKQARQDALLDFEDLKYHPLFIAGMISYWMHGDMTSRNRISYSSADPDKVNLFKSFLDKVCGIQKPKVWINLKKGNLVFLAESYWAEKCGLNEADFGKTMISGGFDKLSTGNVTVSSDSKRQKIGRIGNNHGVCNMVVNSAYLKNKFLKWVELLKDDLVNEKYLIN
jgi:hypothetical protein